MVTRVRHRRTSDPAIAFPTPIEPGELALNSANRQIAMGDAFAGALGVPLPIIATRFFDSRGMYVVGDYAVNGGQLYRCKVNHGPAVFNGANFEAVQGIDAINALLVAGYLPLAGGTLTGMLTLPVTTPSADNHATRKKYVDDLVQSAIIAGVSAINVSYTPGGGISSNNVQAALAEVDSKKAPIASPVFTGNPTAPTPSANDNSLNLATTAYYIGQAAVGTPLMDGVGAVGTLFTFARGDHRHPTDTTRAPLDSPAFTGVPVAPTPINGDNTTRIATTAWLWLQSITNIADGIVTYAKVATAAIATAAQFWANTAQKFLTTDQVWASAAPQTLTDGATVTPPFDAGFDFIWTILATGHSIANPSGTIKPGQKGMIYIVQGAGGPYTITSWGSFYKFPGGTKPTLSGTVGAVDCVSYCVKSATEIECFFAAGMA